MARFEVSIDESLVSALSGAAAEWRKSLPEAISQIVAEWLAQRQETGITEEFMRLVEESITENEMVLRRFSR